MDFKKHQLIPDPRDVEVGDGEDEIYLNIVVGNAQTGSSKVTCNDEVLAKGELTKPTYLGKASELSEHSLKIITNVLDINQSTNRCVITTNFVNQDHEQLYKKIDNGDAPENGIASFVGRYAIKIISLLLLCICSLSLNVMAQNGESGVAFKDLLTPASPGFILLDKTPSSIERPTTPKGLGLSLLGLQEESVAIEVAPYWLKDHPNLTAQNYYNNVTPFQSHFAVSVASVNSDTSSFLSIGARSRIVQEYSREIKSKLDSLLTAINQKLVEFDPDNPDENLLQEIEKLRQQYVDTIEKPVFSLDLATALAGGSNTKSTDDIELSRWAVWTTLNWRPKADDFYATLLSRYMRNQEFTGYDTDTDLVDLGIRLNYDLNPFTASLEYLQRLNFTSKAYDDYRIAVVGNYEVSDSIYLTTTIGKNFSEVNNIIGLAGINFGFSKSKITAY